MKLRIGKPIKNPELPIRVLKEKASHQYQFFGHKGFIGRSPCRSTVTKITPEDVMNRMDICPSEGWEYCNLVDGEGKVLDSMTLDKAYRRRIRSIYREIGLYSKSA